MPWLVRHAPVELDLDRPAHTWELTPDGRADAEELALRLPPVARVLSSPEPKAVATAEPIARAAGVELELDERLREVRRDASACARLLPVWTTRRSCRTAWRSASCSGTGSRSGTGSLCRT